MGASIGIAGDETSAVAKLAEQHWDAMLVDHVLASRLSAIGQLASVNAERRIVLITPGERDQLEAFKELGFTGYLVKPVRAASLAVRLFGGAGFERTLTEPAPSIVADLPREGGAEKSLSVLVAEDNEINALLARALLVRLGHQATVAVNGQAAIEAWQAARNNGQRFDLVLMDLRMPDLDGLEAARRIRALEADTSPRTPIYALTANAFGDDREAARAAGMDGFLVKPLDREQLMAVLASIACLAPAPVAA